MNQELSSTWGQEANSLGAPGCMSPSGERVLPHLGRVWPRGEGERAFSSLVIPGLGEVGKSSLTSVTVCAREQVNT